MVDSAFNGLSRESLNSPSVFCGRLFEACCQTIIYFDGEALGHS